MRKMMLSAMLSIGLLGGFSMGAMAQVQKQELKVGGKCGMCKNRIETTAKAVEGVKSASYDLTKNILTLELNPKIVKSDEVAKKLVAKGHDAGTLKADQKVYDLLPGCCKYR